MTKKKRLMKLIKKNRNTTHKIDIFEIESTITCMPYIPLIFPRQTSLTFYWFVYESYFSQSCLMKMPIIKSQTHKKTTYCYAFCEHIYSHGKRHKCVDS